VCRIAWVTPPCRGPVDLGEWCVASHRCTINGRQVLDCAQDGPTPTCALWYIAPDSEDVTMNVALMDLGDARRLLDLKHQHGLTCEQIAAELGTSEKTIKVHRARVMLKMAAVSLIDLVVIARESGVGSNTEPVLSSIRLADGEIRGH